MLVRSYDDLRFMPRWRQLEEIAFCYAERAARATNATERDRLTTLALSAWRGRTDALSQAREQNRRSQ
jgi:hypothetical protein